MGHDVVFSHANCRIADFEKQRLEHPPRGNLMFVLSLQGYWLMDCRGMFLVDLCLWYQWRASCLDWQHCRLDWYRRRRSTGHILGNLLVFFASGWPAPLWQPFLEARNANHLLCRNNRHRESRKVVWSDRLDGLYDWSLLFHVEFVLESVFCLFVCGRSYWSYWWVQWWWGMNLPRWSGTICRKPCRPSWQDNHFDAIDLQHYKRCVLRLFNTVLYGPVRCGVVWCGNAVLCCTRIYQLFS